MTKQFRHLLAPFITKLINVSLDTGCFPQKHKHAIVFPRLKKDNLDPTELKNYRSISNLTFVSKLLESAIQKRLLSFLDQTGSMPIHQSAYRHWHSTETALLKIYNDLLRATDRGELIALCFLDLSAAFDTDHGLFLKRLENKFGIVGQALKWFKSYLTDRSFSVMYLSELSTTTFLVCSVPQGSVLGPLLFILYTAELFDLAAKWNVYLHLYADDTQLYLLCRPKSTQSAIAVTTLERCLRDISQCMAANRLKLNSDKTELLWTGTSSRLKLLTSSLLADNIGSFTVTPTDRCSSSRCFSFSSFVATAACLNCQCSLLL